MTKTEVIRLRVTPELKKQVETAANAENRSITNFVENLILKGLKKETVADMLKEENKMEKRMTPEEVRHFLCTESNIESCGNCPYNDGFSGRYPCGQQNCWVAIHCEREEEEDE